MIDEFEAHLRDKPSPCCLEDLERSCSEALTVSNTLQSFEDRLDSIVARLGGAEPPSVTKVPAGPSDATTTPIAQRLAGALADQDETLKRIFTLLDRLG